MFQEYPAEFRQRVLRRVAEKDDLDAVAREFDLPADLVFQWLKESAEHGQALGSRLPPSSDASSSVASRTAANTSGWRDFASIYATLFVPFFLLLAVGHVQLSAQARWACLPIWILIGCGLFVWLQRTSNQSMEADGIDPSPLRRVGVAVLFVALSAMSTWVFALALPAIPHRLIGRPVDVRTTIIAKVISHGRSAHYCFVTLVSHPGARSAEVCTDQDTFNRARESETIVLHETTSWFGVMQKGFDLVPNDH